MLYLENILILSYYNYIFCGIKLKFCLKNNIKIIIIIKIIIKI